MKDGEELRLSLSLRTTEQSPYSVAAAGLGRDGCPQESARERSDEEDCGGGRKKLRLSKLQASTLEDEFRQHHTLSPKEKMALAEELSLTPRQVEVWFQNRRARKKLKKTEVDREMLKRCCEHLSEENRRLHKELMHLRALKRPPTPGLCVEMGKPGGVVAVPPPTTLLTICPSCKRATTTFGVTASGRLDFYHASTTAASPAFHRRQIEADATPTLYRSGACLEELMLS